MKEYMYVCSTYCIKENKWIDKVTKWPDDSAMCVVKVQLERPPLKSLGILELRLQEAERNAQIARDSEIYWNRVAQRCRSKGESK